MAAPSSPVLHSLMASRARVLAENGPDRMRAWLTQGQASGASPGERYAAALSAHRLGQREPALDIAQRLRAAVPPEARPTVDALLLELLLAPRAGSAPLAADQARLLADLRDQALAGTTRASVIYGAQAAIATGQPERAAARLQASLRENEIPVLLMMRLVPAVPFFVANLIPAFVGTRLSRFALTTLLGIIPGGLVYTAVGAGLGEVFDRGETPDLSIIFAPHILGPILGLAALAALPIVIKALRGQKTKDGEV